MSWFLPMTKEFIDSQVAIKNFLQMMRVQMIGDVTFFWNVSSDCAWVVAVKYTNFVSERD